jgi:RHS repeat-associated protein
VDYEYTQKEATIFGSSRLGVRTPNILVKTVRADGTGLSCVSCTKYYWTVDIQHLNGYYARDLNKKIYELSDHLGDARVTVSDRKNTDSTAILVSYDNFYAFGSEMPDKSYSTNNYRYGFNGKEKDDEVKGISGTQYDFDERIYDPRIARFLSIDPLFRNYPWNGPYNYGENRPIDGIDEDGEGWFPVTWRFWESREVKTARVFADEIDGKVEKIDVHHARVVVPEGSEFQKSLKFSVIIAIEKATGLSIDPHFEGLTKDERDAIITQYTYLEFTTDNYLSYFKKDNVSLAQVPVTLPVPNDIVFLPTMEVSLASIPTNVDYQKIGGMAADNIVESGVLNDKINADEFAKAKRGKESERQEEVKHGGPSVGVKGGGAKGDKHTRRRPGSLSDKKRQKPNWKGNPNKRGRDK